VALTARLASFFFFFFFFFFTARFALHVNSGKLLQYLLGQTAPTQTKMVGLDSA
jgi:hypothetical protein